MRCLRHRQSEWIDVGLSRIDDLRDLHDVSEDAVVRPPVSVVAENLSQVRSPSVRIRFDAKHGIADEQFDSSENIGVKGIGVCRAEVVCDVIACILEGLYAVVRPLQLHTATLSSCEERGADLAARRFARLCIMRLTCSCDLTSPRMDCPSLMRKPSYVLQSYSFWLIFSQSAAERNTEVACPFCVRMMGRWVSAVRATQSASVLRNSLSEMMSSVGLKSSIVFSPLWVVRDIVRDFVREVKEAA